MIESKLQLVHTLGIMRFSNGHANYSAKLATGDDLVIWSCGKHFPNYRFIKVTRKGFNILNLDTDRCILKRHLYDKGMSHKEFSHNGTIKETFWIPEHICIAIKPVETEKSA